jgi:hypothetical protein
VIPVGVLPLPVLVDVVLVDVEDVLVLEEVFVEDVDVLVFVAVEVVFGVVVVPALPATHWEYQSLEYTQTAPDTHSVSPV